MRFGHPDAVFLFFLLPIFIGLLWWMARQRRKAFQRLADARLRSQIMPTVSPARARVKEVLLGLVFIFLVLAIMEPQWGMREEEVRMRGVDMVVAVDVSNSMLAQDVQPSRLERAKRKVRDLFSMLAGDRVGLIAFAGRSFLLSPLTVDYGTLELFVDELNTENIPVQGTDIAGALSLALKAMSDPDSEKAVLLITDGEDHSERLTKVLETVREKKLRLFVLGVGTPEGAPVPEKQGGFKKDSEGQMVVSKLAEPFLQDLALSTGGVYVRGVTGDEDLRELYLRGIREVMEAGELKVSRRKVWETRFYWPLSIALFFLLLERLIPPARKDTEVVSQSVKVPG